MTRRPLTDEEMLTALDMMEQRGLTAAAAGKALGRSRGTLLAMKHRVHEQTDWHDQTPELNGTMPPRWWKAGLRMREVFPDD